MQRERFPGVLGEIAEVAGEEAAAKIGAAYGGTRKRIPAELPLGVHWLADCVGRKAGSVICRYFRQMSPAGRYRGIYLLIPRGGDKQARLHNRIIQLSAKGWSAARIACALKLTERCIYRHRAEERKKMKSSTRQLWLPPRDKR